MNRSVIKKGMSSEAVSISYNLQDEESYIYSIGDKNLNFINSFSCFSNQNSITEEFYWKVKSIDDSIFSVSNYMYHIRSFKNLIQLYIDTPTEFSFIDFELPFTDRCGRNFRAHYIIQQPISNIKINVSIYHSDIRKEFNKVLEKWFNKQNNLELIIGNYLNDINTNYLSDSKLLNAIKNLEILTRTMDKMREQGFTSSLIVTSDYHMKRTKLIFDRVNDGSVEFIYVPALSIDGEQWIKSDCAFQIWASEFVKLWGYRIGLYKFVDWEWEWHRP